MTVTARHTRRGTIRVFWVATISDISAPTVAEINAGTDMTGDIQTITGFEPIRNTIPMLTTDSYRGALSFVSTTYGLPTLTIYDEGTGNSALRTTLATGAQGHVVFCLDGTPVSTDRAIVWPVLSMGPVDSLLTENEAATMLVSFEVWSKPDEKAVIA